MIAGNAALVASPTSSRHVTSPTANRPEFLISSTTSSSIAASRQPTGTQTAINPAMSSPNSHPAKTASADTRTPNELSVSRESRAIPQPQRRPKVHGGRLSRGRMPDTLPPQCQSLQGLLVPRLGCVAGFGLSPLRAPKSPESDGNITDGSPDGRLVRLDNLVKKIYTNLA